MRFELPHAEEILERTPAVLRALLGGLPAEWTMAKEPPDGWSPFDVVGHLIHGEETDWIPRARIILTDGERRTFEPFDRFAQFEKSKGKAMAELLDEFAAARRTSLDALRAMNLGPRDLERTGRHPELGVVTLAQLLATWAVSDLAHTRQIARAMAKQWADEIGPWRAYMRVVSE
jgi:hypothetical protein